MTPPDRPTDEEYAAMLLSPLTGDPATVSRVDVARAMAEGRRRRHLRRYSGGAAVAALTASALLGGPLALNALDRPAPVPTRSALPTAAPSASTTVAAVPDVPVPTLSAISTCVPIRLPTEGVAKGLVTAGDPSGRYLAGRIYPTGDEGDHPILLWRDGTVADRIALPGTDQALEDINSAGEAVGRSYADEGSRAYVYANGEVSRLRGGNDTFATSINDAGVIAGYLTRDEQQRPAVVVTDGRAGPDDDAGRGDVW